MTVCAFALKHRQKAVVLPSNQMNTVNHGCKRRGRFRGSAVTEDARRWDILKGIDNFWMLALQDESFWCGGLRFRKELWFCLLAPLIHQRAESYI